MITLQDTEVVGFESAIRGMRNPLNSWARSDSHYGLTGDGFDYDPGYVIGDNDLDLMYKLAEAGPEHSKYRRMIVVYVDVTAPLFWWKEMDTYKVGTVRNSCSTMHKIHSKEFTSEDFSVDLTDTGDDVDYFCNENFYATLALLNDLRTRYLESHSKHYWRKMIEHLPSSYNQRATLMLNYEVLAKIYRERRNHKLVEWHEFCDWIKTLPYSEVITCD